MSTQEIIRLTLKALDFLGHLPTRTTDKPEANAESSAKADPITPLLEGADVSKQIFSMFALRMDAVDEFYFSGHM